MAWCRQATHHYLSQWWPISMMSGSSYDVMSQGHNELNLKDVGNKWWRHQMETFSALLAICAGNSPVSGEFPAQRPVTRNFYVFFDLRPNKLLSKQWWSWWFETPSRPLWRCRNVWASSDNNQQNTSGVSLVTSWSNLFFISLPFLWFAKRLL